MKQAILYEAKIYARNGQVTISPLQPKEYTYDETSHYVVYKRQIWHDDKSLGPTDILIGERHLELPEIDFYGQGYATGSITIHENRMWDKQRILEAAKREVLWKCRERESNRYEDR